MRSATNIAAITLLGLLAFGCKGDSSASKSKKPAESAQKASVEASIVMTLDGKAWQDRSLGDLFGVPASKVELSDSTPLTKVIDRLGVISFKAVVATDKAGKSLRIGESVLRDTQATITLQAEANGPTITATGAPSVDADGFGTLASLDLSTVVFRMPEIDLDSTGSELTVVHDGKTTPFESAVISEKSAHKMQRNGREVSVLPLADIAPADYQGRVMLKSGDVQKTLEWPPENPIYLYVNRRGFVHALIGDNHARHVSGSGRTENKASPKNGDEGITTVRKISTIEFLHSEGDTPSP